LRISWLVLAATPKALYQWCALVVVEALELRDLWAVRFDGAQVALFRRLVRTFTRVGTGFVAYPGRTSAGHDVVEEFSCVLDVGSFATPRALEERLTISAGGVVFASTETAVGATFFEVTRLDDGGL
jgi:hypothetical protein